MADSMKSRLTTPMIRENGELRATSWEQALARAAEGLRNVKERYGQEGFGMFSCSKTTNELNFLAQKFARSVMGTNNIDSCNRT
jgi:formate dehydrogenase (hydrogenase)